MTLRVLALLAVAVAAAGCDQLNPPSSPEPVPVIFLSIAPDPAPTLTVGQTLQFVAIVTSTTNQNATWTSSNPSVVPVGSTNGLATCAAPGIAVITAVSVVDATARDAVTVQCTAAPAPVALIQITPTSLTFTHIVGTTACAQTVGTVVVRNVSNASVQVTTTSHTALVVEPATFTLAAGATRTVTVRFNCTTQQSFVGTVRFRGTAPGGATQDRTLQVTGTINR